jgi:hypothetical protein
LQFVVGIGAQIIDDSLSQPSKHKRINAREKRTQQERRYQNGNHEIEAPNLAVCNNLVDNQPDNSGGSQLESQNKKGKKKGRCRLPFIRLKVSDKAQNRQFFPVVHVFFNPEFSPVMGRRRSAGMKKSSHFLSSFDAVHTTDYTTFFEKNTAGKIVYPDENRN